MPSDEPSRPYNWRPKSLAKHKLTKYYEEAKYNAAFDRCVDVMTRLIQKYGHQVLENKEADALKETECSEDDKQEQPLNKQAA